MGKKEMGSKGRDEKGKEAIRHQNASLSENKLSLEKSYLLLKRKQAVPDVTCRRFFVEVKHRMQKV